MLAFLLLSREKIRLKGKIFPIYFHFRLKMVYDTYQSLDTFGRQLLNFIFPNVTAWPRGRVTAFMTRTSP